MPSCMNNAKWCCVLSESVRRHRILVGEFLFLILRRFSSFLHLKCYFLIPFSNWITTVRRLFKIVQLSWSPKELPSSGFSIICSFWIPFPLRSRNFSKKLQPSLSSHTPWPGLLQPHRLGSLQQSGTLPSLPGLPFPALCLHREYWQENNVFTITFNCLAGLRVPRNVPSSRYLPWLWVGRRWQEVEEEERKACPSHTASSAPFWVHLHRFSLVLITVSLSDKN